MIAPIPEKLEKYNVVWESPSKDASGSMPIGNGYFGANVWVEQDGDLLLLLAINDAWDENGSLLKLGRVRISFPNHPTDSFRQTLDLANGEIRIQRGAIRLSIWVDAHNPVLRVEADSAHPFDMIVRLEMWRTAERTIKTQTSDIFKSLTGPDPFPTVVSPDRRFAGEAGRIAWCHRNELRKNDGYEINLRLQGLGDLPGKDFHPLLNHTFGCVIRGEGFDSVDDATIRSKTDDRRQLVSIHALAGQTPTLQEWKQAIDRAIGVINKDPIEVIRDARVQWWRKFWERSFIFVNSGEALHLTKTYLLQTFLNACAGRGPAPIKHNGSIFSYGTMDDPDFRRWGGPGFWFMNQRLIYWPLLAEGDFDLMLPWLRMYRQTLDVQKHRTRTYFNHGGAHYPETIMFWGAEVSAHYGWTPFAQRTHPEAECPYLTYYWSGGIELTLMLLEYFQYTGDEDFAREFLLPIADAITEFYDLHFPRDEGGKIHFEPAQALETWHEAVNPLPEIAGLRYMLAKLIEALSPLPVLRKRVSATVLFDGPKGPSPLSSPGVPGEGESLLKRWTRMLEELPEIPVGEKDGKRVILPAERFDKKKNTENPELYSIFPYRLHGIGKPDLQLARDTFEARLHKSHECWSQDEIQMALLGLTDQVKESLLKRAAPEQHSDSRFPGFHNAHKDWCPDVDHAGVLQMALQLMLLQCEGREIRLLPAWPMDWDVDFKLHAPFKTVVEASVREGKIVDLKITPESRRADVILPGASESAR